MNTSHGLMRLELCAGRYHVTLEHGLHVPGWDNGSGNENFITAQIFIFQLLLYFSFFNYCSKFHFQAEDLSCQF
jgi:hypothetical protein